jgi:hypothetical protein
MLWFCIWTPYAAITMIAQFGNPMLVTPVVSQLPSFLGKIWNHNIIEKCEK